MREELEELASKPRHVVAILGGAVSGSEAAVACADKGITAIVVEQNERPYGKIEDGLPRWHDKLRAKEYARIDENLARDGIYFVPRTKIGEDIPLETLTRDWGVSAVLLANGAWRDRPLPVEGADAYVGKGLVYQNSFVYWFNHYEEPGYDGPVYEVSDDAVVVGGGLASVDVVKIINLELYRRALRERGIEVSVVEMEHKGITATLKKHDIDPDSLGVKGCTLYYRRRIRDMPLAFPKENATPEQIAKTEGVREKMVGILETKFRVRVKDQHVPVAPIVEDGRMVGLNFRRTEVKEGRAVEVEGSDMEVRAELIVSSIGSVPERVPGIPTKGELYDYASWETGAVSGMPGVFGVGNVLTGKGNIRESRNNSKQVTGQVIADYLGLTDDTREEVVMDGAHEAARARGDAVAASAIRRAKVAPDKLRAVAETIEARWSASGYGGDYAAWLAAHKPSS